MPLPAETHIGYVHLKVRNLARMVDFYVEKLGLRIAATEAHHTVHLSAHGELPPHISLTQIPEASLPPRRSTGLYHLAIRFPTRHALARVFRHLIESEVHFQGFSDHKVSEAIYLADPEGNGVEIYTDKPRELWPRKNGNIEMLTTALDMHKLLAELSDNEPPFTGIDPDADIGHVHLKVSSLHRAEAFYHRLIGMRVTQRSYPGALFFAAGDYHHHVGANIWLSAGAPPPSSHVTGLLAFSIHIPDPHAWFEIVERLEANQRPIIHWIEDTHLLGVRTLDLDHLGVDLTLPRTPSSEALWQEAQELMTVSA